MAQTYANKKQQFLSYDYTRFLRGVCMLSIVFGHTANEFTEILTKYNIAGILYLGRFATGIFFFLSGYGLTLSIMRNRIDRFYIGRHMRGLLLPFVIFWLFYFLTGLCAGSFPCGDAPYLDFLSLKMPGTDTWFFRTIIGIYVLYFCLAKISKPFAYKCMAAIIVLYVLTLAYFHVTAWWWNTILCFPIGIIYASNQSLRRKIPIIGVISLFVLFVILQKTAPFSFLGEISAPIACSLFFAYLSPVATVVRKVPVITFIGTNSLYVYFMEAIPIDYLNSNKASFAMFVFGCIAITVILTYSGKYLEKWGISKAKMLYNKTSSKEK